MSHKEPKKPLEKNKLGKKIRRRKIAIMKGEGFTVEEMSKALGVSDSTVDRDLKSAEVQEFVDELIRQQLLDIKKAPIRVRLHYRDSLIDKHMPKKMEQKIEGGESFRVEIVDNTEDPEVSSTSPTA